MPPFQRTHTPLDLLDIVRVVSLSVSPEKPKAVTQSAWDEGRTGAGHSDAPRAHAIAQRLGVPWRTVLRIAHGDRRDALRALRQAAADKGRRGLTLDRIAVALRQAALRLDKPGINRGDYQHARDLIVGSNRPGSAAHTVAARALPELTQIETVLGQHEMSWEDALAYAGLEPPERFDNRGADADTAVGAFAADLGAVPRSGKQLRRWAQTRKVSLGRTWPSSDLAAAIARLQSSRAAAGDPPLPVADAGAERTVAAHASGNGARAARTVAWDKATIIPGLARAVRLLASGQQLTQRRLKAIAKANPDQGIPSWSPVDRCLRDHHPHESWDDWRREAERLARSADSLAGSPISCR